MNYYTFVDGEFEYTEEIKRSVFIATVSGEVDETSAEEFVKRVRKKYSDARHNCYAYVTKTATKYSDDGEPGGTAGLPMLDVLKKQGLINTAVVVTRYFGGIKLGANGLLKAYTGAVATALKSAKISKKVECKRVSFSASYPDYALVESLVRKNGKIENVSYGDEVQCSVILPKEEAQSFISDIISVSSAKIRPTIKDGVFFYKFEA